LAGAVLTIDLGALRRNFRLLRDEAAGARCAAVLKADAYGLGADKVAPVLAQEGCDTFFVAHVSEGIALRHVLGDKADIFVLNGLPPGAEGACAASGLIPVLNTEPQLAAWRDAASALARTLPAALQVDSGMARMGMSPAEVEHITADPGAFGGLDVRLIMSHLACADESEHRANRAQFDSFLRLSARLPQAARSLANSSGIFLGPEFHFDLVRPGAALYGINPQPRRPNPLAPVVQLEAKVIQTRSVEAREGIGYGHVVRADRALQLATIALGYADGWPRHAQAAAWYQGVRLPFIGRVSMDSIILDVSALPPGTLAPGALVELIGPHQSVDEVAAVAGTIGYEILTSLGRRFHRVYVDA
jgi:alanine racemase